MLIYSLMLLPNSATVLLVSVLLDGRSPLRGSYIMLFVHVLALITGSRIVIFVFAMARNRKHSAILAHSTGDILSRSVHVTVTVTVVSHLIGTDSLIALQIFHGLSPNCNDDQLPAGKARMPQNWARNLEATASM